MFCPNDLHLQSGFSSTVQQLPERTRQRLQRPWAVARSPSRWTRRPAMNQTRGARMAMTNLGNRLWETGCRIHGLAGVAQCRDPLLRLVSHTGHAANGPDSPLHNPDCRVRRPEE